MVVGVRLGCSLGCGSQFLSGWGLALGCWGWVVGSVIPVELPSSAESHGWLLLFDLVARWVAAPKVHLAGACVWLLALCLLVGGWVRDLD